VASERSGGRGEWDPAEVAGQGHHRDPLAPTRLDRAEEQAEVQVDRAPPQGARGGRASPRQRERHGRAAHGDRLRAPLSAAAGRPASPSPRRWPRRATPPARRASTSARWRWRRATSGCVSAPRPGGFRLRGHAWPGQRPIQPAPSGSAVESAYRPFLHQSADWRQQAGETVHAQRVARFSKQAVRLGGRGEDIRVAVRGVGG